MTGFSARGVNGDFPSIKDIAVEDIGAGSEAMASILRCALTYHDDAPEAPGSVIVKLSSPDKKSLRIAKLLSMYKREYFCFRQLAPYIPIALPQLFYGDFDNASHRFVLHSVQRPHRGPSPNRARRAGGVSRNHLWHGRERHYAPGLLA